MTKKERFEKAQEFIANAEKVMGNIPKATKIALTISCAERLRNLEKGGHAELFITRSDGKRYESIIRG